MDWQKLFRSHILERGYQYYCDGAVDNLVRKDGAVIAEVYGTDVYDVEIGFADDTIIGMTCSCPYADGENFCKHMAAVLYELNEGEAEKTAAVEEEAAEFLRGDAPTARRTTENDDLLSLVDEYTLRKFVADLFANDESMRDRLKNFANEENSKKGLAYYREQVDRVDRTYGDRYGYIVYQETAGYIVDLERILVRGTALLLEQSKYLDAFQLTSYVLDTAIAADLDDSDGWLGQLIHSAVEAWTTIVKACGASEKREIFAWFEERLDHDREDLLFTAAETVLMHHFLEGEFTGTMLALTERKATAAKTIASPWLKQYEEERWAKNHLRCMEAAGLPWEERKAYCRKNWELPAMRAYYIEKQIKEKQYDKAIAALRESMVLDQEYWDLIHSHSLRLKEIYRLSGRNEEYVNQLWQLMLKDAPGDLKIYRELRDQYTPDEWVLQRERIFTQLPSRYNPDILYKEDQLYDRLLEYVLKEPGLFALEKYHKLFKKAYPRELIRKYEAELEAMALQSSDRNRYREMVRILKKMGQLEGGREKAQEIAGRWKRQYRRRRAMMEELAKL